MKRSTLLYLLASCIVAIAYGFPTNGLSHFDEGQYAFARVWPWIDKFDVDQAFFSPPLYPFLVGLVQHLPISRPDLAGVYISHGACWISLYLGVKLAVMWWGESVALPAFVLLLLSPMRLAFGTIGLTDAFFSMLMLATLLAATRAFHDGSTGWTVLAGLLAGSTWSCKYNGFIVLAIIAGFLLHQRTSSSFVRWVAICLIAAAIMTPWYWAFQTHHPEGIAALQKHQQGYLRGFSPESIWSGLQQGFELRGEVPGPSVFVACWAMLGIATFVRTSWVSLAVTALLLAGEECSSSKLLPMLSIAALPIALLAARPHVRAPIVLAVGATVFVPAIYTPYLRLWLPGEHILLIVLAGAVGLINGVCGSVPTKRALVFVAALVLLAPSYVKVCAHLNAMLKLQTPELLWNARLAMDRARRPMTSVDGYSLASKELVDYSNTNELRTLMLYARPPLLYYLAQSDLRATTKRLPDERISLERLPPESMIVADIAVRDSKQFAESLREGRRLRNLQRINGWNVSPHPLTMLDDFGGYDLQNTREYKVNLYLLAPFAESKP